jgi:hypothetical protein
MAKLIQLPTCGEWVDPERVSSVTIESDAESVITGEVRVVVRTKDGAVITVCHGAELVEGIRDQVAKYITESIPRQ